MTFSESKTNERTQRNNMIADNIIVFRYALFDVQGSKQNLWLEALFSIEEVEEDFQIVIEALAGRSRLTDIAIDDVALLRGAECFNEALMTSTDVATEEDGGIYDIQSCSNRCNETQPSTTTDETITVRAHGKTALIEKCDCHAGCEDIKTCCLDYRSICVFGKFYQVYHSTRFF